MASVVFFSSRCFRPAPRLFRIMTFSLQDFRRIRFFSLFEKLRFTSEEVITQCPEAVEQCRVCLSRGKSGLFPFFLCLKYSLGHGVPFLIRRGLAEVESFYPFAQGCLDLFVFPLACFTFFEMCLIFLFISAEASLKEVPYLFADILCHLSDFSPFVMQALQASECCDHILLFGQFAASSRRSCFSARFFLKS